MADLRWILLLAGLVFLAALTAWELRRPRQGRRDSLSPTGRSEPELGRLGDIEPESLSARSSLAALSHSEMPPLGSPLVISLDEPVVPTIHPTHSIRPIERFEPVMIPPEELAPEPVRREGFAPVEPIERAEPPEPQFVQRAAPPDQEPVAPIVEWPPEDQRQIISVRVVGANPDRLSGRPLRQALAACGFVHGRFGIFHQPGADGRALISAANLNKPGVFDPSSMDFQRFRGLGLFTVLPGPLPPAAALDHLLDTAGDLAERLQARLQDEHGMPLDDSRLEAMARIVQDMSNGALRSEPAA
jgi:FtsZ-interacting cell division protein ZipA